MAAPAKHKEAILQAAARLFRRQGYAATGLNEIVAGSGAPKGSLYHYFPGGKAQLGEAVVTLAGQAVEAALKELTLNAASPAGFILSYASRTSATLERSGFTEGCPIATTLLETTPADAKIAAAGQRAFASWQAVIASSLTNAGVAEGRAGRLSSLALAAIEGALIQARVEQSTAPLTVAAEELAALFDAAVLEAGP